MLIRYGVWVLRIAATLGLILGILTWFNIKGGALVGIHMLLGIIVTLCLWLIGAIFVTVKGGSTLGIIAFAWGIVLLALGLSQTRLLTDAGLHWIIQVLHLLIGLGAIGIGEAIGARYKRQTATISVRA